MDGLLVPALPIVLKAKIVTGFRPPLTGFSFFGDALAALPG